MDYCKELLLSASSARSKYYQYLDDKKKEAENKTRNNRKRKVIDEILHKTENKRKFTLIAKLNKCKGQTKNSRNY